MYFSILVKQKKLNFIVISFAFCEQIAARWFQQWKEQIFSSAAHTNPITLDTVKLQFVNHSWRMHYLSQSCSWKVLLPFTEKDVDIVSLRKDCFNWNGDGSNGTLKIHEHVPMEYFWKNGKRVLQVSIPSHSWWKGISIVTLMLIGLKLPTVHGFTVTFVARYLAHLARPVCGYRTRWVSLLYQSEHWITVALH